MTDGLIGMLSGSSLGLLTSYSVGATTTGNNRDQRFGRGEMTARWGFESGCASHCHRRRQRIQSAEAGSKPHLGRSAERALEKSSILPSSLVAPNSDRGPRIDDESLERTAWLTGRSVYWNIVESSKANCQT